jgi:hypothetical protein
MIVNKYGAVGGKKNGRGKTNTQEKFDSTAALSTINNMWPDLGPNLDSRG